MLLSFLLLLLITFSEMRAGMGFTDGGTDVSESLMLFARLNKMERLLHVQDAKLVRQEALLRQQEAKLSRQESVLRQQDAKLSRQESLLFQDGKLIQQLRAEKVDSRSEFGNSPTSDKLQQPLPDTLTTGRYNVTGHMELPPVALESDDILTSAAHDVISRSDDGGPLEAVVSHISQQVTELSVDIQTLKNSNSQQDHDIQDAQSSTFVHWSSSQCGGSSHLVYSGVVGGSHSHQLSVSHDVSCV